MVPGIVHYLGYTENFQTCDLSHIYIPMAIKPYIFCALFFPLFFVKEFITLAVSTSLLFLICIFLFFFHKIVLVFNNVCTLRTLFLGGKGCWGIFYTASFITVKLQFASVSSLSSLSAPPPLFIYLFSLYYYF